MPIGGKPIKVKETCGKMRKNIMIEGVQNVKWGGLQVERRV